MASLTSVLFNNNCLPNEVSAQTLYFHKAIVLLIFLNSIINFVHVISNVKNIMRVPGKSIPNVG